MPSQNYRCRCAGATSLSVRFSVLLSVVLSLGLAMGRGQSTDGEDPASLRKVQQHFAREEFDEAARLARDLLKRFPESFATQQLCAEVLYRSGFAKDSLEGFNRAVELSPKSAPHNWQRGIALATCGRFKEGAAQFKTHHDVNPGDVENSAWYFLCIAKSASPENAKKTIIPSRGGDRRVPMMAILDMLRGAIGPDEVIEQAKAKTFTEGDEQVALFYADLYIGLYYDSLNEPKKAKEFLQRSLSYGHTGYMADTAKVYLAKRFSEGIKPSAAPAKR